MRLLFILGRDRREDRRCAVAELRSAALQHPPHLTEESLNELVRPEPGAGIEVVSSDPARFAAQIDSRKSDAGSSCAASTYKRSRPN